MTTFGPRHLIYSQIFDIYFSISIFLHVFPSNLLSKVQTNSFPHLIFWISSPETFRSVCIKTSETFEDLI